MSCSSSAAQLISWFTQRGPAPSQKGNGMGGVGTAPNLMRKEERGTGAGTGQQTTYAPVRPGREWCTAIEWGLHHRMCTWQEGAAGGTTCLNTRLSHPKVEATGAQEACTQGAH